MTKVESKDKSSDRTESRLWDNYEYIICVKRIGNLLTNQVQDPIKWRRLNGWMVIFWIAMFIISIVFNLLSIVAFISLLSLYANVATHLGVWAASRAEAKQVETED